MLKYIVLAVDKECLVAEARRVIRVDEIGMECGVGDCLLGRRRV